MAYIFDHQRRKFLLNTKTKVYHKLAFFNKDCRSPKINPEFWQNLDSIPVAMVREYNYCKHCARRERRELGAIRA